MEKDWWVINMQEKSVAYFEMVYREYYPRIISYICSKVKDRTVSEDLTSEVFYKCYKSYEIFDPQKASISTWLFVITKNLLKNYYRDRRCDMHIEEMENFDVIEYVDFDEAIYLEEVNSIIEQGLMTLNQMQRDAVLMKYYRELTTREIALALGTTEGNVRVILSRALKKLRVSIEESEEWE